ncbi:AhpC/Tsa family protein GSU0066 [hydrothermal vent metagenome]|uniref:thioredoxin-dependent peroxiredoxin n=1 Tax=hydrothermal vent metagenome TaxID=652676 RepID=A0A3B0Z2Q4_9ZZZZ
MTDTTLSEQTQQTLNNFMASLPDDQQATIGNAFQELMASAVATKALSINDQAITFELPNVRGGDLALSTAVQEGPVVLSFYRGSWCPFCNLELNALQSLLPQIKACGARLIAISPELPDSSLSHAEKLGLGFDVLADVGNKTARDYGLIMTIHESLRPLYLQWGLDVPAANGDDSHELPVPATYVIDTTGTIRAAYIEKDYTKRMEPAEIIAALQQLG